MEILKIEYKLGSTEANGYMLWARDSAGTLCFVHRSGLARKAISADIRKAVEAVEATKEKAVEGKAAKSNGFRVVRM